MILKSSAFSNISQRIFLLVCFILLVELTKITRSLPSTGASVVPPVDHKAVAKDLASKADTAKATAIQKRKVADPLVIATQVKEKEAEAARKVLADSPGEYTTAQGVTASKLSILNIEKGKKPNVSYLKPFQDEYDAAKLVEEQKLAIKNGAQKKKEDAEAAALGAKTKSDTALKEALKAESDAFRAKISADEASKKVIDPTMPVLVKPQDIDNDEICKKVCAQPKMFPLKLADGSFKDWDVSVFELHLKTVSYKTDDVEGLMTICNNPKKAKCVKTNLVLWAVLGSVGGVLVVAILVGFVVYKRAS